MLRSALHTLTRLLPSGAPGFIYTKVLVAAPLRAVTNRLLLSIVPDSVKIQEGTLYLDQTDPVISGALTLGVYEPFETALFRKLIQPGMTVLDIGANIGYYTIIAARLAGPQGRVLAFEPSPDSFAILKKNITANELLHISAFASAVADREGMMTLHISSTNKGNHSLVSTKTQSSQFTSSVEVPVERIDTILAKEKISKVDVIKIDVEGAEPLAFAGMAQTLSQPDVAICMEFYPELLRRSGSSPEALLEFIIKKGFMLNEMDEKNHKLLPISDINSFVKRFKKGEYSNLLCLKGSFSRFHID